MLKKIIFQIFALYFVLVTSAQSGESGGMPQLNPEFWVSQIFWLILTCIYVNDALNLHH